jgi:hypothetical protein
LRLLYKFSVRQRLALHELMHGRDVPPPDREVMPIRAGEHRFGQHAAQEPARGGSPRPPLA